MAGRGKGVRVEDWTAGDEVFLKSMSERRMNYFFEARLRDGETNLDAFWDFLLFLIRHLYGVSVVTEVRRQMPAIENDVEGRKFLGFTLDHWENSSQSWLGHQQILIFYGVDLRDILEKHPIDCSGVFKGWDGPDCEKGFDDVCEKITTLYGSKLVRISGYWCPT